MMAVRARFQVMSITSYANQNPHTARERNVAVVEVTMKPVYSSDPKHENKAFWDATPGGELKMSVTNLDAVNAFQLGQEYYLDFTPADGD
jgi:hypothetical protein